MTLHADFDAPFPVSTDVITVNFDGVTLVEAPFSAFRQTDEGNVYMLSERRLLVRIDFDTYTILAKQTRADLTPLDTGNGVAVEVRFGSNVMVETIEMEAHSPSLLEYYRPE